jgi:hypothetical protein
MLERQREGIAAAKAAGNYKGRPASIDAIKVLEMRGKGLGPARIAQKLGIAAFYAMAREFHLADIGDIAGAAIWGKIFDAIEESRCVRPRQGQFVG